MIKVKNLFNEISEDQRLSQGNLYFKTQVLYHCIDTVITQFKTRFAFLDFDKIL